MAFRGHHKFLIALGLLASVTPLAWSQCSTCNNSKRTKTADPGVSNTVTDPCGATTFHVAVSASGTVMGDVGAATGSGEITITLPSSTCPISYLSRDDSLWECSGTDTLAGYNCNPVGFKSPWTTYEKGGCRGWGEIVNIIGAIEGMANLIQTGNTAQIQAAVDLSKCKPATVKATGKDGSATITSCN